MGHNSQYIFNLGRGCDTEGAYDPRGPRFESRHHKFYTEHLFDVNCLK